MRANRKKYIKHMDELTKFERRIINRHPEGLVSTVTEGPREIGKSMFSYITMTRIFQYLEGVHVDDAYLRALDHFRFTLPEVIKSIDEVNDNTDYDNILEYDRENQYRILTLDDAGTHMGKYKFYTDISNVEDLKSRLDTIRDVTTGLMMTTPTESGLLSFIRDYPDTKVITLKYDKQGNTKYDRIIEIRDKRKKWARQGRLCYPPIKLSIWVDDWAYVEYKKRKRMAIKKLNDSNKKSSHNEIRKMFQTVKKLNPTLTQKQIIELLNLPEETVKVLKSYHNLDGDKKES